MKGIKNPYGESLIEIEGGICEHGLRVAQDIAEPYGYTDEEFRASLIIFADAMTWKMWEHLEGSNFESKLETADNMSTKLRTFIKEFTGIDTHKLYKEE